MADFQITRDEAKAGICYGLAMVKYHEVLATWQHESGAWLSIETPALHLGWYIIYWRSGASYASTIQFVTALVDHDPDIGWALALGEAQKAFEKGPSSIIRDKVESTKTKQSVSAKERHAKERAQRAENATPNLRTESGDKPEQSPAKEKPAIPPTPAEPVKPELNRSLDWRYEMLSGTGIRTCFMHYKAHDGTGILFQNSTITENGDMSKHVPNAWSVYRHYPRGETGASEDELIQSGLTLHESFLLVNRLMDTDPATWVKGDFK